MKSRRKKQLNNKGFSLVEVLVAMVVLSILSIPVLSSFSNAARINNKARREENANTAASDIVEKFKLVSMEKLLSDYVGSYTENGGVYTFNMEETGANGEKYRVETVLEPGRYKSGDDEDNNYNNNINSYVNSAENFVLREDLYSYDAMAEKTFSQIYTSGFDKNKISKVTNIKIEVKHNDSSQNTSEDGQDAFYQRVTLDFEYKYDNNNANVYKPETITYADNYFRAAPNGDNSYKISTALSNNLKEVYIFYVPYDRHSVMTVEGDGSRYYSEDKINITYNYSNEAYVRYEGCNVFIIQQTTKYQNNEAIKMALNRANISLKVNGSLMNLATKGTLNLGTSGGYGGADSTASGPVSIFSNIYNWDKYVDVNNKGTGSENGVASKNLLYKMTVNVYYDKDTEPMAQLVTTKVG